ncbi:MAG: hypothetical protein ACPGVU_03225 [Limisphaerales bacterium]
MELSVDMFDEEIAEAMKSFDNFVVCLDKAPDDCAVSLQSLLEKAIKAYMNRSPGLRHGIALDRQITIILSQVDATEKPMCGIYFNLSSPYHRQQKAELAAHNS